MTQRHIEGAEVQLHEFLTLAIDGSGQLYVSVTYPPPSLQEKEHPHNPLNRRMGRFQSQSRCFGEMMKLLHLPAFKTQNIQPTV